METLFEFQKKQVEHDREYHRDIFFLNYQDRFKHMVMHYGKYAGRLANLLKTKSDVEKIQSEIKRTLIDCFIIVLSCADLLQLNLEEKLKEKLGIDNSISLDELANTVKEASPTLYQSLSSGDETNKVLNLMLEYTAIAGELLKVGEDLDHMVGFDRNAIREQTINILTIILISSLIWKVDLSDETTKRWDVLVKRTVNEGPQ